MRARRYLLPGLLLGALALTGCARPLAPADTSQFDLISAGMPETEVIHRLGPPGMVTEQPRTPVQIPLPNGVEFREKRRYTYYYPGPLQHLDLLITFEDGVVVGKVKGRAERLLLLMALPLRSYPLGALTAEALLDANAGDVLKDALCYHAVKLLVRQHTSARMRHPLSYSKMCLTDHDGQTMPSIYDLKPRFQNLLRPLIRGLARIGWRPNAITLLALLGSCGVGGAIAWAGQYPGLLFLFPLWLFVRMALNAIDGMMARELHMATPLGAVLNELGDVLADLALYVPFALVYVPAQWSVVTFALGAILTEFCGVLGQALVGHRRYEGPMGKSDRAFLVSALALLTGLVPAAMHLWPWVFGAAALLTAVTCWNRLAKTLQEVQTPSA